MNYKKINLKKKVIKVNQQTKYLKIKLKFKS